MEGQEMLFLMENYFHVERKYSIHNNYFFGCVYHLSKQRMLQKETKEKLMVSAHEYPLFGYDKSASLLRYIIINNKQFMFNNNIIPS
jgi:hypothetical protein